MLATAYILTNAYVHLSNYLRFIPLTFRRSRFFGALVFGAPAKYSDALVFMFSALSFWRSNLDPEICSFSSRSLEIWFDFSLLIIVKKNIFQKWCRSPIKNCLSTSSLIRLSNQMKATIKKKFFFLKQMSNLTYFPT